MKRMKGTKPKPKMPSNGRLNRLLARYGSGAGRHYDSKRRGPAIANKRTGWYVNV